MLFAKYNCVLYEKAIECYRKCIQLNPREPKHYCDIGLLYNNSKNYKKSIDSCNKAIEIDPKHALAYHLKCKYV